MEVEPKRRRKQWGPDEGAARALNLRIEEQLNITARTRTAPRVLLWIGFSMSVPFSINNLIIYIYICVCVFLIFQAAQEFKIFNLFFFLILYI